jgi:hypothetical protein
VLRSTAGIQPVSHMTATTTIAEQARITSEPKGLRSNGLFTLITAHANRIFSPIIQERVVGWSSFSVFEKDTSGSLADKEVL